MRLTDQIPVLERRGSRIDRRAGVPVELEHPDVVYGLGRGHEIQPEHADHGSEHNQGGSCAPKLLAYRLVSVTHPFISSVRLSDGSSGFIEAYPHLDRHDLPNDL